MRMVQKAEPEILRMGRGRATQYGLRLAWPNLDGSRFPLFRITESGKPISAGELITLAAHQSAWMPVGSILDGLPAELADARPSGFLGRHFAALHADLRLPLRLSDWSDHHTLLAMSRRGEDLPGNLIIGEESFARWQALLPVSRSRADYPALAEATIRGHPPGSSAGGERQKFGALVGDHHMLVKFSGHGEIGDVVARRWSDLLILEGIALAVVASHGIPAAHTNVIEASGYRFLESERFDRLGARGRIAVVSLAAVHDDLSDSWARAAVALRNFRRLSDEDARRLRWLDAFGALIANTDRHQYNILFSPKVLICDLLRRSIKSRCCMRLLGMGKCRPASLYRYTRQPIRWMSGRMFAMPRGSFGHTGVRMRGYLTMLDCFVQAMRSS